MYLGLWIPYLDCAECGIACMKKHIRNVADHHYSQTALLNSKLVALSILIKHLHTPKYYPGLISCSSYNLKWEFKTYYS